MPAPVTAARCCCHKDARKTLQTYRGVNAGEARHWPAQDEEILGGPDCRLQSRHGQWNGCAGVISLSFDCYVVGSSEFTSCLGSRESAQLNEECREKAVIRIGICVVWQLARAPLVFVFGERRSISST